MEKVIRIFFFNIIQKKKLLRALYSEGASCIPILGPNSSLLYAYLRETQDKNLKTNVKSRLKKINLKSNNAGYTIERSGDRGKASQHFQRRKREGERKKRGGGLIRDMMHRG